MITRLCPSGINRLSDLKPVSTCIIEMFSFTAAKTPASVEFMSCRPLPNKVYQCGFDELRPGARDGDDFYLELSCSDPRLSKWRPQVGQVKSAARRSPQRHIHPINLAGLPKTSAKSKYIGKPSSTVMPVIFSDFRI